MNELNTKIRKQTLRVMLCAVIVCTITDVLFFVYYMKSDTLESTVEKYLITRLLIPLGINYISYFIALFLNYSKKISSDAKNMICAFALCTIGGCMGIFHGWFVPLWCAPAIAMVYCSVFHSRKLQNMLLIYCIVLTTIAALYISGEHPDRKSEYIQNGVVVGVMTLMFRIIGSVIERYSDEILSMTLKAYEKEREYQRLLSFDDLTQVYSRPYLVARIKNILDGSIPVAQGCDITLAILDVDHFKKVNDTYGHESGDDVLRTLGSILHEVIDKDMIAGRYGGEEFLVLLTNGTHSENIAELERLRRKFGSAKFDFCDDSITFSCGCAKCSIGDNFELVLSNADAALYKAKREGRNRLLDHQG